MNQERADSAMPSSARVARRIWWFTVSNAADRSRRMRTDERDEALAARRDSVTARRAVSVDSWLVTARSSVLERNERRDTGL